MLRRLISLALAILLCGQSTFAAVPPWKDDLAAGRAAYERSDYATATTLLQTALKKASTTAPHSAAVGQCCYWLGSVYQEQERFADAEPLFKRALSIDEQLLGREHPDVALDLSRLAEICIARGRYTDAEPLLKRALATGEKALGAEDYGRYLYYLAEVYRLQGKFGDAEPLYQASLKIKEKLYGPDHPKIATRLDGLAQLYQDLGRFADAEPLYRRALAIREKNLGPDDPLVASSLNNLGLLLKAEAKHSEAEALYKRALAIREKRFGEQSAGVAESLNNLALLLQALGRYGEAEPLLRRAVLAHEKACGGTHPNVATTLNNLASLLKEQERYSEAEPLHRRALSIFEEIHGLNHPSVATALNNLALLLEDEGRYAEAEPLYKRCLAMRKQILGNDHPDVATVLNNLATLYKLQGRDVEAESLYKESLTIHEKRLGKDHPEVAIPLSNLGELYDSEERPDAAEQPYRRAIAINEKAYGVNHNSVAAPVCGLAEVLKAQGRYQEAELLYKRALAISEQTFGAEHSHTAAYLRNLADLYQLAGRYSEAEPLFKRAIAAQGTPRRYDPFDKAAQSQRFNMIARLESTNKADILERSLLTKLQSNALADVMPEFQRVLSTRTQSFGSESPLTAEVFLQLAIAFASMGGKSKELAQRAYGPLSQFSELLLSSDQVESHAQAQAGALGAGADRTGTQLADSSAESDLRNPKWYRATSDYLGGRDRALAFCSDALLCLGSVLASHAEYKKVSKAFDLSEKCIRAEKNCSAEAEVTRLLELAASWQLMGGYARGAQLIDAASQVAGESKNGELTFKCLLAQAKLNLEQADFSAVRRFARQALDKGTTLPAPSASDLSACYNLLAESSAAMGKYDVAMASVQSALQLPHLPMQDKVACLLLSGSSLLEMAEYGQAKRALSQVLSMRDTADGVDESLFTAASSSLANALVMEGAIQEARRRFDWALFRDKQNPSSDGLLAVARDDNGLALVESIDGNRDLARRYALDAAEKIDKYINTTFAQLSFGQQCAFLALAKQQRDALLGVCNDKDSLSPAYGFLMKWKGLLLESLRRSGAMSAAISKDPGLAATLEELAGIRKQLAGLANKSNRDLAGDLDAGGRSERLTARKEQLERALVQKSNINLVDPIAQMGAEKFRELLHADEAFVDIVSYRGLTDKQERYAAIAMKSGSDGQLQFFDLGGKPELDQCINRWRFATTADDSELARDAEMVDGRADSTQVTQEQYVQATDQVAKLLVTNNKLQRYLGNSIKKLWLCPEGSLARIPWQAIARLTGNTGLEICDVDSPREFVVLRASQQNPAVRNPTVMLAGLSDFRKADLNNLPGALREIEELKTKADAQQLTTDYLPEQKATKDSVKDSLKKVSMAHISTHGFARGTAAGAESERGTRSSRMSIRSGGAVQLVSTARSPLVECGLYLAEPAEFTGSKDELPNVLTAEEIIGLDLSRCNLVTLSACQTGLGRGLNGQGVIGLRSAILGAGAHSLLMSLWSVDDEATRELMKSFYGYLWDREHPASKLEALDKAQQYIRGQTRWQQPKYWAGWVLAGDGWN